MKTKILILTRGVPGSGYYNDDMNEYTRQCPSCGKMLTHTNKYNCRQAIKKKRKCLSCVHKEIANRPEIKASFIERLATPEKTSGVNNPFYGKAHTEETKNKLRDRDNSRWKTDSFRQKMKKVSSGGNNPMFGRTFYEVWVEKHGVEEAEIRLAAKKAKNSQSSSGSNNPMFGKPTPRGAGNGWKGWYKRQHFRSLHELTFMVKTTENGDNYTTAEIAELVIPYTDWAGKKRTYRADFLLNNTILVECKPAKLWDTTSVQTKKKAADIFCEKHGFEYKLMDYGILTTEKIIELYNLGEVVFESRYNQLFCEKYI